jgi:hypothetical protein
MRSFVDLGTELQKFYGGVNVMSLLTLSIFLVNSVRPLGRLSLLLTIGSKKAIAYVHCWRVDIPTTDIFIMIFIENSVLINVLERLRSL